VLGAPAGACTGAVTLGFQQCVSCCRNSGNGGDGVSQYCGSGHGSGNHVQSRAVTLAIQLALEFKL
jgi:hypothetical protein